MLKFYRSLKRELPTSNWTLTPVLLLLALYSIVYGLLLLKIYPAAQLPLYLSPQFYFIFCLLAYSLYYRLTLKDLGLFKKDLGQNIKVALVAIAVPTLLVLICLGPLIIFNYLRLGELTLFSSTRNWQTTFPTMLRLAILAPLAEELFFRGFLIPPLEREISLLTAKITDEKKRKYLLFFLTLLVSALFFTLAHGYLKFGAFLLGLGSGWIYLKTGSVLPTIILHAYCNAWGPILWQYLPDIYRHLDIFYR